MKMDIKWVLNGNSHSVLYPFFSVPFSLIAPHGSLLSELLILLVPQSPLYLQVDNVLFCILTGVLKMSRSSSCVVWHSHTSK